MQALITLTAWTIPASSGSSYIDGINPTPTTIPLAVLLSPTDGSILEGSDVTFTWTDIGSTYFLYVGSTHGTGNYYSQDQGSNTSVTVTGLPVNGSPIYVRLWTNLPPWNYNDYAFTAAIPPTHTPTPIVTSTPMPLPTNTPEPIPPSPTPTPSQTSYPEPSLTPTNTATPLPTKAPPTNTPTPINTPTSTSTPIPPSPTMTPTLTPSPTQETGERPTVTPSPTPVDGQRPTPTPAIGRKH